MTFNIFLIPFIFVFASVAFAGDARVGHFDSVQIQSANGNGNYVELKSANLTANRLLTFPDSNGTSGQVLTTNGAGVLSWTTASGGVPSSRAVNTTAPLTGGGTLASDLTLAIPAATTSVNGYLTSTDWSTFNGKQAAGHYPTSPNSTTAASLASWADSSGTALQVTSNLYWDNSTNRLGVGTATPAFAVDAQVDGAAASVGITGYSAVNAANFIGRLARGSKASPTAVGLNDQLANFVGRGYNGTSFSGNVGGMSVQATESYTTGATGSRLVFVTEANGTTTQRTRMVIEQDGKIGIGTSSPGEMLHVVKDQNAGTSAVVQNSDAGANAYSALQVRNGLGIADALVMSTIGTGFTATSALVPALSSQIHTLGNLTGGLSVFSDVGELRLGSNGTQAVHIDASQKVGIGTTSPANRLDVVGDASISTKLGVNVASPTYNFDLSGSLRQADIGQALFINHDTTNIPLTTSGIALRSYDNWPQLSLFDSASAADEKLWDTTVFEGFLTNRIVNDAQTAATNYMQVHRGGMAIDYVSFPNGNVGIGIASPSYKLDVTDSIANYAAKITNTSADPGAAGLLIDIPTVGGSNNLFNATAGGNQVASLDFQGGFNLQPTTSNLSFGGANALFADPGILVVGLSFPTVSMYTTGPSMDFNTTRTHSYVPFEAESTATIGTGTTSTPATLNIFSPGGQGFLITANEPSPADAGFNFNVNGIGGGISLQATNAAPNNIKPLAIDADGLALGRNNVIISSDPAAGRVANASIDARLKIVGNGTSTGKTLHLVDSAAGEILTVQDNGAVTLSDTGAHGGNVPHALARISNTVTGSATCTATCSAGKIVTGGGCDNSANIAMRHNFPSADNIWDCEYASAGGNCTAWAICAAY